MDVVVNKVKSAPQRTMVVSLIGRPNVGKSSLYNRIMRSHSAITFDAPGVTRDRHYGIARFDEVASSGERECILVDTGGFYPEHVQESEKKLNKENDGGHGADPAATNFKKFFNIMTDHAKVAIDESDLVLFVVDAREGLMPFDESIASYIRSTKKKFWVLVNKYDTDKQMGTEAEFYSLGIDEEQLFTVSASHGLGMGHLIKRIQEEIMAFEAVPTSAPGLQQGVTPREEVVARVAIIGAPNAGKSTLLNELLGSHRALVSDIPGTTVDPIEGFFDLYFGVKAAKLDELRAHPTNNELLFKEYQAFRENNPDVHHAMTIAYEYEQVASQGGDETVQIDHLFEGENELETDDEIELEQENEIELMSFDDSEREVEIDELLKENDGEIEEFENILDERMKALEEMVFDDVDEESASKNTPEKDLKAQENSLKEEIKEEKNSGSYWRTVHLVDTAGIRKQGKVEGELESQTVYRSLRCIAEADIIIHLVDATKGIAHQDRRLIDIALERGKSVIVGLNKMDLMSSELSDDKTKKEWLLDLKAQVPWLSFCDLIPFSAKYGKGLSRLCDALKSTILVRHGRVSTGELNRALFELVEKTSFTVNHSKGVRFKIKYASQVKSDPPTFLLFTNKSKGIPDHYRRYLQNGLRTHFKLVNTPVHLVFRTGHDLALRMKRVSPVKASSKNQGHKKDRDQVRL